MRICVEVGRRLCQSSQPVFGVLVRHPLVRPLLISHPSVHLLVDDWVAGTLVCHRRPASSWILCFWLSRVGTASLLRCHWTLPRCGRLPLVGPFLIAKSLCRRHHITLKTFWRSRPWLNNIALLGLEKKPGEKTTLVTRYSPKIRWPLLKSKVSL